MPSRERAPAVARVFAAFGGAMRRRRWRWYVFGGQAVIAHGRPRLTADVDVTVDLHGAPVHDLVGELQQSGFALRFPLSREFLEAARLLPLVHLGTGFPVDVVMADSDLQAEFLARRKLIESGGAKVPMISAEDLIATKLLAGRRKDLEDARGVLLERGARLDLERVRHVIASLDAASGSDRLLRRLERLVRTLPVRASGRRSASAKRPPRPRARGNRRAASKI